MKLSKFIPLAAMLALAAGCAELHENVDNTRDTVLSGHAGGAYKPRNTGRYDFENHERFVLLDKEAQRRVTHAGIQERVLEDGRLEVAVNFRNRKDRRTEMQVSCIFKNEQGFAIDETPFQTLILTENAQETVRFTSMNNQARLYTIRVRTAR